MQKHFLQIYHQHIEKNNLKVDSVQDSVVKSCEPLYQHLSMLQKKKRWWSFLIKQSSIIPKGLYIYGGVGCGKSMLMDLFYEHVPVKQKRRVHFHEFMADIHHQIYQFRKQRQAGKIKEQDPIAFVADQLAKQVCLLCFDEFQVRDIADASILARLFKAFFERGIFLIMTSNRAPEALYKNGLHRERFLPFIDLLNIRLDILHLESNRDYRQDRQMTQKSWFIASEEEEERAMDKVFQYFVSGNVVESLFLSVQGRKLFVPQSFDKIARFSFADLCEENLGASDYLQIVQRFEIIFIDNIPLLDKTKRNEATRFIHLIDVLYEYKVKLFASSEASPERLYVEGDGVFEFLRTVSRLQEMQSVDYP